MITIASNTPAPQSPGHRFPPWLPSPFSALPGIDGSRAIAAGGYGDSSLVRQWLTDDRCPSTRGSSAPLPTGKVIARGWAEIKRLSTDSGEQRHLLGRGGRAAGVLCQEGWK